jgi:hypothetical protein
MNSVEFHIEQYIITYSINWLGIETIAVNHKVVSKKLSLPNQKHSFSLTINDETVPFYIKSRQSFSTSTVTISLFKNNLLIEKRTFEFYKQNNNAKDDQSSTYILGLVFVILSLYFDWHKYFLFIGLVVLFYAFNIKPHNDNKVTKAKSEAENHNKPTNL